MQQAHNPMHGNQAAFDIKELKYDCIYLSYNLDNNNPALETVQKLYDDFLSHYDDIDTAPDFVIIGLQEAKRSWRKGENLAERLMKRWSLFSSNNYTILYNDSRWAYTHPEEGFFLKNLANRSFTHLYIACKRSLWADHLLALDQHGTTVKWWDREGKGGLFSNVKIKDVNDQVIDISFSTVHLDSKDHRTGNAQLAEITRQCGSGNMLGGGDFNTRAHANVTGIHAKPRNRSSLLNGTKEHAFNRACFEAHLADQMTALLEFRPHLPDDITYSKVQEDDAIPYNDARGAMDFGALDFFIMKGDFIDRNLTEEHARVISLKRDDDESDLNPSDHKPVMGKFVILRQTIKSFFDRINTHYNTEMRASLICHATTPVFHALSADEDTLLRYLSYAVTCYRLDILRDYFLHAQEPAVSSSSVTQRFKNVSLAMRVVLIVLDNLASLRGQCNIPVAADYIPNTYGQCEIIEAQLRTIIVKPSDYQYGKFMLDCFNKLLDERTACPDIVRIGLLLPFWRWLEKQNISHAGYGYRVEVRDHTQKVTMMRGAFFEYAANAPGNRYVSPDACYVECGKR